MQQVQLYVRWAEKKETKRGATNKPACRFTVLFPEVIKSALKAAQILPNPIYLSWQDKLVWKKYIEAKDARKQFLNGALESCPLSKPAWFFPTRD